MFAGRLGRKQAAWALVVLALTGTMSGVAGADAPGGDAIEFPGCERPLDVLFLFDTTGSMGGVLASAKSGAAGIMNAVVAAVPTARFGVANYRDYPASYTYPGYSAQYGSAGDFPWQLNQPLTTSTAAAGTAINGLSIGSGADWPESLSRALHESKSIAWAPNAVKLVVLFADAPPHDLDFAGQNFGSDPGPDAIANTADDIDFETLVASLAASGVQVVVVDSGGGAAAAHLRHVATGTAGAYELLGENFVAQVTSLILNLAPRPTFGAQSAALVAETSVPANPRVDVTPMRIAGTVSANQHGRLAHATLPPALDGFVTLASSGARGTRAAGLSEAFANSTVSEVSLYGGLVRARDLRAVASATTVPGASSTSAVDSFIGELWVNGVPIPTDVPANTIVPIPGVGMLVLKETRVASNAPKSGEIMVTAIHLVVDTAVERADVRIATAYAASSCGPATGSLLATFDNDAGTGGDVGNTPQTAYAPGAPSVFQGRMVGKDFLDYYRVNAGPGYKVEAVMLPSARATVAANPLPGAPTPGASVTDFDLRLLEPGTFAERELSRLPLSAPDRVELNVDVAGDWVVEVSRPANAPPGNYTMAIAVTPIALLAQNDALSGTDAPDTCAASLPIGNGAHVGVLRDSDYRDWYRTTANIGDALAVTVKPTEDADGANFDLFVYDAACRLVASSQLGEDNLGVVPKGAPDVVPLAPVLVSQTYHVEVRRINGIGNYYLALDVTDPQPTVAPISAESGGDAGSSAATATPIPKNAPLQGKFPDGDNEDWYSFAAVAGQRIVVAKAGSLLSDFRLELVRPNGSTAVASSLASNAPEALQFPADASGTWHLRFVRVSGGGDYTFAVSTLPP